MSAPEHENEHGTGTDDTGKAQPQVQPDKPGDDPREDVEREPDRRSRG